MPEATAVTNTADSEDANLAIASNDDSIVSKPQVISDGFNGASDIVHYTVEKGDTVQSVAEEFGISDETVRLSNNLGSDTLNVGMTLLISPINGLIYRAQPGDTAASLADKFHASEGAIISFNGLNSDGKLTAGNLIVVPDGTQASTSLSNVQVTGTSFSFSFGGVGYPAGWCTYYAAARSGAPSNWGNAATWAYYAALTPGWTVSKVPKVGAIAQTAANHVGIVEAVRQVNGQYQIKYSDMNGIAGFGRVGYSGWVSSTDPFQNYIYH